MKKQIIKSLLLLVAFVGLSSTFRAQVAIGQWRDHLSYKAIYHIAVAHDRVYGAAAGGLYYYDLKNPSLVRLNKTTDLNDVGISALAYDGESRYLVVAYSNGNIDLLYDDHVFNISDIKRSDIAGDKHISNIRFSNRLAYLTGNFGVVVVDLLRHEIKETYYLGPNGTAKKINDVAFTSSLIVAATDDGIMYAPRNNRFLNIVSNWTTDSLSLLSGEQVIQLAVGDGDVLFALTADASSDDKTLFRADSTFSFFPWLSGNIKALHTSQQMNLAEKLTLVVFWDSIVLYNNSFHRQQMIDKVDWMSMAANDAALTSDNELWIAHGWDGMIHLNCSNPLASLESFYLNGPASDESYKLSSWNNNLYACPGGHSTTYANLYRSANLFTFSSEKWSSLSNDNGLLSSLIDISDVAENPRDSRTVMIASWGRGVAELSNGSLVNIYNQDNTDGTLQPYESQGYSSLRTGSLSFDPDGNLWVTNSLQPNGLVKRDKNGAWTSFSTYVMVGSDEIDHIIVDTIHNYKIFWGRSNKIFVHDGNNQMAYIDPNSGAKLQTSRVNSVVQDHNGNLWVGTNKGIKVIYDLASSFRNGGEGEKSPVSCSNIVFNQNGINEYLLAYENVSCIVVDGANRKWVGTTTGGLYLLSANGLEELAHFTSSNSPLFSDKIVSLSILPWTGELFIATEYGIQSYRSTATYAYSEPDPDIHVFPNPVRPDYDGPIAIKGFTRNGLVHITDQAGHTVFSTTAHGGQAIWNGRTNEGKRVGSGVYYVFASSANGDMRSVAKVLIVR